jgi:hypothetical protein
MTLQDLIAVEDAAFTAWVVVANSGIGMERYETPQYRAYITACKAVNKAVIKQNTSK